jgi:hypothetical protein
LTNHAPPDGGDIGDAFGGSREARSDRSGKGTDGTARVTGIKDLGHAGALGGYTPFRPMEDGDKAILKEAT